MRLLMDDNQISLSDVRHIVLDEADTLFDESFAELVTPILYHCKVFSCICDNFVLRIFQSQFSPKDNTSTKPEEARNAQAIFAGATLSQVCAKCRNFHLVLNGLSAIDEEAEIASSQSQGAVDKQPAQTPSHYKADLHSRRWPRLKARSEDCNAIVFILIFYSFRRVGRSA